MYWINSDSIVKNDATSTAQIPSSTQTKKPQPRWGQACITAHNKLFIIGGYEGQYLGDVWAYDFTNLSFTELKIEGDNLNQLCRSNHTAVYYQKHNSIYVFGGGQSQRQRFNDTLKLEFDSGQNRTSSKDLKMTKVTYAPNSQVPISRTYHASCLINCFMVVIGGEANSDLRDFWALNLDTMRWYQPDIEGFDNYTAKRFHSASAISDTQVVTFGGCHSEYVHMNEMHIFQMSEFLQNYEQNPISRVICNKINVTEGVPSTRWGHSASVYKNKLYILGGRNEHDIIDLHEFDPQESKWKNIEILGQLPKARRRHTCLFISGSMIMFGGFDGSFYNDLNILDFTKPGKSIIQIQPSTIEQEYASLVNNKENSDIVFQIPNSNYMIYAHKALLLFRTLERELPADILQETDIPTLISQGRVPDFLVSIYQATSGSKIYVHSAYCRATFLKLLEFLYCDKFIDNMTTLQVRAISELAKNLNLTNTSNLLKRKVEIARNKIQSQIVSEIQAKTPLEPLNISRAQQKQIKLKVDQFESSMKFDFSLFEDFQIQSPEDKQDRQHWKAASLMNQCKNLDEFYDIVFNVGDTLIKANSTVLMVRSPYFQSMLSSKYQFKECTQKVQGQIKVVGVPKSYFTNIIQYIYSDHFYIQRSEVDFFVKLLIYADYFMLPRLVDICSSYLKPFVNTKNVLKILLVAHAHNAEQLESFCINFISKNEDEVLESRNWRHIKRQAQESLLQTILQKIREEKEEQYVQICIQQFMNKHYPAESMNNKCPIKPVSQKKGIVGQQTGNEEELDLDDMLNTSTYIYLEDHQKFETYKESLENLNTLSAFQVVQNKVTWHQEEEKEVRGYKDKENVSLYSNMDPSKAHQNQVQFLKQKEKKPTIQQIMSIPINNQKDKFESAKILPLVKKRDIKRQPLSQIDNDEKSQISDTQRPPFKRGSDFESQSSSNDSQTTLQSTQNCNIFQRI